MVETYTLGYGPMSIAVMASRTAGSHAGFFISQLRSGMTVLDIGCGPGTVTLGIAERVRPGSVIGSDLNVDQSGIVAEKAAHADLDLTFEQADVYALPFPDNHFGAVFISALLGNLRRPQVGVAEAYRVLKSGGVIGVKEFDEGANILFPELEYRTKLQNLYMRLRRHHGHDPEVGRKIRSFLNVAGFVDVQADATFEPATPRVGASGNAYIEAMVRDEWGQQFIELGWTTSEQISDWIAQSAAYRSGPNDFTARAWVEATALKPG
jgi:ubiquinone/menaquinone biosynthesis C-methylase UbiE